MMMIITITFIMAIITIIIVVIFTITIIITIIKSQVPELRVTKVIQVTCSVCTWLLNAWPSNEPLYKKMASVSSAL
jgi:hypothetical protein